MAGASERARADGASGARRTSTTTRTATGAGTPGYSGTPLARKLGLRDGQTLALLGAPAGWNVPDLPPGVRVRRRAGGRPDVTIAFVRSTAELTGRMATLPEHVGAEAALWIAWPRRAGGHSSDVTDNGVRALLLPTSLVDVKVAALDDDWSGLKFVWRVERRGRS